MFSQWRRADSIRIQEEGERHWWPEYYDYHQRIEPDPSPSFWDHEDCHYCTWGEVLFGMLAWRLCLRSAQEHGWNGDISEPLTCCSPHHRKGIELPAVWSSCLWDGVESRETWWVEKQSQRDWSMRDTWAGLCSVVGDSYAGSEGWAKDWASLRLLNSRGQARNLKTCPALYSLLSYAAAIPGLDRDDRQVILEARDICLERPLSVGATRQLMLAVQHAVLRVAHAVGTTPPAGSMTVAQCLDAIHRHARFPLLPYFYWAAMAPQPRTHCVIPVWHAPLEAVTLPWTVKDQHDGGGSRSSVVGFAAIGLAPFAGLDWTHPDYMGEPRAERDRRRFDLVRQHVETLANPLVSLVYVDRERQKAVQAHEAAAMSIGASLEHRLRHVSSGYLLLLQTAKNQASVLRDVQIHQVEEQYRLFTRLCELVDVISSPGPVEVFDFVEYVREYACELKQHYPFDSISVTDIGCQGRSVRGRRNVLWWVLEELAYNAHRELREARRTLRDLRLHIYVEPEQADVAYLRFSDNGRGIAAKHRNSVFCRGYSTSKHRTGLGLWQARNQVEQEFHGELCLEQTGPSGTTFRLAIPLVPKKDGAAE
jgi:signal transduction histidine kinase